MTRPLCYSFPVIAVMNPPIETETHFTLYFSSRYLILQLLV